MNPTPSDPGPADAPPPAAPTGPARRLASLDVYRGFVMFLMMGELFHFCAVSRALPGNGFWKFLCEQQSHVDWIGCVLHDMIQPSFSFLVGAALPFSLASRAARGQSAGRMTLHALGRSLVLILLGVFLRSTGRNQLNWTFEDTLSQIGLGYPFLFLIARRPVREQWVAFGLVVAGYWAAFAWHPLPPADFNYAAVGVDAEWMRDNGLTGFAAHWQKNSNLAWSFDTWFLNLFPREKPFLFNGGGYATLSFIPTLGTMILGLLAGGWLRAETSVALRVRRLVIAGVIGLAAGTLLGIAGVCPVVKRIWTPTWVLFSGGWCCLFLAAFHGLLDWPASRRGWSFPLLVIGMNSIAAYCMAHLFDGFILRMLKTVFGQNTFKLPGAAYEPFLHGSAAMLVLWLLLWWMYRRQLFLRI